VQGDNEPQLHQRTLSHPIIIYVEVGSKWLELRCKKNGCSANSHIVDGRTEFFQEIAGFREQFHQEWDIHISKVHKWSCFRQLPKEEALKINQVYNDRGGK
jgi:hypothetical protein